jgi:glycerol-3-phosphate O-acyltransferase/dihydroxyacetone phosphate acyltransferase
VLSIFFSSIEIYGKENIPRIGPAIFTSNHNNQFVDGAMVVATNPFQVSFLVAEKSMKKRIIGDFARAVGGISVKRPQDCAKAGEGKVMFEGMKLRGDKTKFTALQSGKNKSNLSGSKFISLSL